MWIKKSIIKKPLKPSNQKNKIKQIKKSTTNPYSGYMMGDNKLKEFFYLYHQTADSRNNIIMDVQVTSGNIRDSDLILKRIDRIEETFNIKPKYPGYSTNPILKEKNVIGI